MLRVLPAVLTGGPETASLRLPAQIDKATCTSSTRVVLRHAAAAIGSAASGADGENMSDDTPGGSLNVPPSLTSSTLAQVLQSVYKLVRSCPEHVFQFVRNEQPQLLTQLALAFRALQLDACLGKLTALTRSLVRVLFACAEQHSTLALASAPAGSEPIEVAKEASHSYFSLCINLLLHSSEAVRFTTSATAGALHHGRHRGCAPPRVRRPITRQPQRHGRRRMRERRPCRRRHRVHPPHRQHARLRVRASAGVWAAAAA
jgi:hypothetical protein